MENVRHVNIKAREEVKSCVCISRKKTNATLRERVRERGGESEKKRKREEGREKGRFASDCALKQMIKEERKGSDTV